MFNLFQGVCVFFLFSLDAADIKVRANAIMRGVLGDSYSVSDFALHPDYDGEIMDYDIALLKVSKPTLAVMTFCNVNKLENEKQPSDRLRQTLKLTVLGELFNSVSQEIT